MSIVDAFSPDAKVELKVNDLKDLLRIDALNWAQNTCMINGLKAGLPAEHILTMIGENEEEQPTVYDVDKVVEELEEYRDEMAQFGCDGLLCDMLEVVKGGGTDESKGN